MAVVLMYGFEMRDATAEILTLAGTAAISQTQAQTGTSSLRCNPASGAAGRMTIPGGGAAEHAGVYIATMPTAARVIWGGSAINNVTLNTDGTLGLRDGSGTLIGTSTQALVTGRWYWIAVSFVAQTGVLLQIDGVAAVTGTMTGNSQGQIGCTGTEASPIDIYFDDVIIDDTNFLNPSRVALCVPISDNAVGAGWTLGTGTAISAGSGSTAVKNTPPVGVADLTAGSDPKQVRNAAANTNAYAANLTTYATAGIVATDTVLACYATFATGAPSATSPKSGSMTLSNPTIAKTSFGTFESGATVAGTYPTNWKITRSAVQTSPTVTIANSPVLTVTQDTSSTRVSMVCFMGMYVAWTTGARNPIQEVGTFGTRGPRNINQRINRSSSY